ncbi:unnamed protein product [Ceratitis capitata]|uniref:(Mediterranean fruit fly) hypothetical protein n=1 Tax=Ceratitis capitata TaxID=7213 RepID=W8BV34_CERCA|nr:unnamed protein product [Ceratitis capitata]
MSVTSLSSQTLRNRKFKLKLAKFLKDKDIPQWYRAFSTFQLNAMDKLMSAIRDDVEQDTSHRVRYCLSVLGLQPLLGNKGLRMMMHLSGGNDLAFLWFLMEFHYKTPDENDYSLNEQLIISAIAHLDMITTLRGLDSILPQGHRARRPYRELKRKYKAKQESAKFMKFEKNGKLQPYFEKLERPIQIAVTNKLKRPDFKVRFRAYEKYKDPHYEPPNEKNRWFAMYTFRESVRIPVAELRLYFDGFFQNIVNENRSGEKTALTIIDSAIKNLNLSRKEKSVCIHHQREAENMNAQRAMKQVQEKEKCLARLELFRKQKQARLSRIHETLEREVNAYRALYKEKEKTKYGKQYLSMLSNEQYNEYSIEENAQSCITPPSSSDESTHTVQAMPSATYKLQSKKETTRIRGGVDYTREASITFLPTPQENSSTLNAEDREYLLNYDYGHSKTVSPTTSQYFFTSPTQHQPYKFNYDKIFNCEYKGNNRVKFIRKICARTLQDRQDEELSRCFDMPTVAGVAKQYADNYWVEKHVEMRKGYIDIRKQIGLTEVEDLSAQGHLPSSEDMPADMPKLGFYDCEDKELMHRMLRIALSHLAKNPKYVLASLKDCHKLPFLREWIYQRYGKRYTQAERIADFKLSRKMLIGINNLKAGVRIPRSSDIAKNAILKKKSTCHSYLNKKVKRLRNAFFQQTGKAHMENARLMWLTMNDAMCSISHRDIFFSYMPQRIKDLHYHNPWSLRQVRDMKMPWKNRLKQQRESAQNKF